jgi:hypothetical protein
MAEAVNDLFAGQYVAGLHQHPDRCRRHRLSEVVGQSAKS